MGSFQQAFNRVQAAKAAGKFKPANKEKTVRSILDNYFDGKSRRKYARKVAS